MVLKERGESAGMVWPPVWAVTHARVGGSPMERTDVRHRPRLRMPECWGLSHGGLRRSRQVPAL